MKNLYSILIASVLIFMFSFAPPLDEEAVYKSKFISFSVERIGSTAVLNIDIKDVDQFDEISIRRSTSTNESFRQVKFLNKEQIKTLINTGKIIDKYPLPGNRDAYYQVVATSKDGISKQFPSIKLSKY